MNFKKVTKQIGKYFSVGIIGGMINISILLFFTELIHLSYMISAVYSFMSVTLVSFSLDKIWTFKEKIEDHFLKEYFNFFSFSIIALIANLGMLYFFTEYFRIYYVFSQIIAIGLSGGFNFFLDENWTFTSKKTRKK